MSTGSEAPERKPTRKIQLGSMAVGGDAPISIQSMTNTDTRDAEATLTQIRQLEEAGCEIIRVAVPDEEAAGAMRRIRAGTRSPSWPRPTRSTSRTRAAAAISDTSGADGW